MRWRDRTMKRQTAAGCPSAQRMRPVPIDRVSAFSRACAPSKNRNPPESGTWTVGKRAVVLVRAWVPLSNPARYERCTENWPISQNSLVCGGWTRRSYTHSHYSEPLSPISLMNNICGFHLYVYRDSFSIAVRTGGLAAACGGRHTAYAKYYNRKVICCKWSSPRWMTIERDLIWTKPPVLFVNTLRWLHSTVHTSCFSKYCCFFPSNLAFLKGVHVAACTQQRKQAHFSKALAYETAATSQAKDHIIIEESQHCIQVYL